MSRDQTDPRETPSPPLNLSRTACGYLVIAAGVALTVVVLSALPSNGSTGRPVRLAIAVGIAVVTGLVYQYVTSTWYEQFTR